MDTFANGTKADWDDLGFLFTAAWTWTQEQRDQFMAEALANGFIIGNLDFVMGWELAEVVEMISEFEKGTPDIHAMIKWRVEHSL